jgi:dihydropyrimidinase
VHFIGSDHNSWPRAAKQEMWSGLAGLPGIGMILPVAFTEGYDRRGIPVEKIVEVTSTNAAKAFGLWPQKGALQVGSDADLVIMDVGVRKIVTAGMFHSAVDYTPYEGYVTTAWPHVVVARGKVVYRQGKIGEIGPGRVLNAVNVA